MLDKSARVLHPHLRSLGRLSHRRIRRHRPRPVCLHDAGRHGRRRGHARSRRRQENPKSVAGRGRKVVELDLKDKASIPQVLDLLANADALIEGFRPGVMERLGLGPDLVLARNPRLVYGRMTGWGQQGPLRRPPAMTSTTSQSPARWPRSAPRRSRCRRSIWSAISAAARFISWSGARGATRSEEIRQGPGGRCRDVRRRSIADVDVLRHGGRRPLDRPTRGQFPRRRRAFLRRL